MTFRCILVCFLLGTTVARAGSDSLADRLCARYDAVKTLSCQTRKTTMVDNEGVTMLSRVYYQQPNLLNVETISPLHRRIVSDGQALYLHQTNSLHGFSRPLGKLDADMRMLIGAIAATPLDHILYLRGNSETTLPPLPGLPLRRGYAAGTNIFAVLNCDQAERLVKIDYFKSPAMDVRIASTVFTNFLAVSSNCWLALRQQTTISLPSSSVTETRVFETVIVNLPLDQKLFDHTRYFKDIPFVAELSAME